MPVSRRTAQPAISDADPELPEKKPAKADGPRNIEAQQTASKIAFPATVTAEPISVAQTTTSSGAGKPDTLASLAEATQSNTAATLDEPAARPQIHERVTVTSAQSFPAPVTPGLDPTTSRLVTAIASDMGAQQTPSTATLTPATAHQAPVAAHTLKIELHPAELGVVNAHLRLTGEQLSIELLPDTQEAYRRLSSDGDTIARALRDLGFDVGKITVLQPSIATAPAPRTDAGGSATALPNRDSSSFQSGQSGSNGNGSGGHHSGRSNDNDAQSSARSASTVRSRTDSGLVI
jgi:chemotaxis protein MotD